jgi:hypothetical protein
MRNIYNEYVLPTLLISKLKYTKKIYIQKKKKQKILKNYSYFFASSRNLCLRPIIVTPIEIYSESDNFGS